MIAKRVFRGYSEAEVKNMEDGYYLLNFGGDFILDNGFYLFTQKEATKIYRSTLKKIVNVANHGNEKDKAYAMDLLGKLVIQPMRLH